MATRILVVNDTAEVLDMFRVVLEEEGYLASQGVRVLYKPFDLNDLLAMIKQAIATNKDAMKNKEP